MNCRAAKIWSRRRVVHVAAAAVGLPFLSGFDTTSETERVDAFSWTGVALGAPAKITLFHPELKVVQRVVGICLDEITRLESIFSLYRDRSELVLLNRDGVIRSPSLDLRILLEESQSLGRLTDGAFDVTVQPLWQAYADHFRSIGPRTDGPTGRIIDQIRRRVDYRQLDVGKRAIGFLRPGMAATLNGIAQGAITDRVAHILGNEGFDRTLVNFGEIAASAPPDSPGWRVGIGDPERPGDTVAHLNLANRSVATSAGEGTKFDAAGRHHHLFDPATGRSALCHRSVSVISRRAMLSDALSTALSVLPFENAPQILRKAGADRAVFVSPTGSIRSVRGA